ncbi:hypothetical protein Mapa_000090 [Marchantia paleacea]|nr:hypothetical protein Mapa_000090 [Marchantia paleacea]
MVPQVPIKIYAMPGPPEPYFVKVLGQGGSKAIIGTHSSFVVCLYDKLNNQVTKLDDIMQYNITMVVNDLMEEQVSTTNCVVNAAPPGGLCSYTIYQPGTYALDIWADNRLLFQQSVTVQEPSIYAPTSRAYGDGVGTTDNPVVVGIEAEFVIEAYDSLNNALIASSLSNVTTTFDVSGYNLVSTGVIRPANGYPLRLVGTNRVLVRYTVYKSGPYVVNVRRSGAHILGSPFYVTVYPGEISSMSTVDADTLALCKSGQSHAVTVTARDKEGNIRTHMEDVLTIIKTVRYANESEMDTMKPLGEGVYTWNFTCRTAGTKDKPESTQISIYSYRAQVWDGMIPVAPGPADPKQFIVGAFYVVTAGEVGMTTVVAADAAGNVLWDGGLPMTVYLMSKEANTSASGEDWYNGTYTFTWMMTKSQQYTVVAEYNSSTFYTETIWVFPGHPDAQSTSVTFDGTTGYTAGVEGTLWIQFFDAYQNNITADVLVPTELSFTSLSVDAEVRRATFMAKTIVFADDRYAVTFVPLYAGAMKVHLKINNGQVLQNGEPYTTQVIAGPPLATRMYAWGGGWTAGGVIGGSTMFFLRLRDAMDNLIETEPPLPLTVTFTPAVATDFTQTYMAMGLMMITYVPSTAAPEFTISVGYDSLIALTSGILMTNGTTGNYSAARSVVTTADGMEIDNQVVVYSFAGESIAFLIQPRDTSGFPITTPPANSPKVPVYVVRITATPTQVINCDPTNFQGTFELSSDEARDYLVVVRSSDSTKELPNSGFTVKFLPGPSSPANCIITRPDGEQFDPSKPLVAGHHLELIAQAKDAYDNVQIYSLQNADIFVATLTAGTTTQAVGVSINFQSTYRISLQVPVVAGAGTLIVNLNGAQVASFGILVIASTLYLRGTEITPWYLDPMISGQEAYFDIIPVDAYQNVINSVNATQQIFAALAVVPSCLPFFYIRAIVILLSSVISSFTICNSCTPELHIVKEWYASLSPLIFSKPEFIPTNVVIV